MSTWLRPGWPSYLFPASTTNALHSRAYVGSSASGDQIAPSLSVDAFARFAPDLMYQSGIACLSSYGMMRIASRWPCLCASDSAASMIDHSYLPRCGSICDQNQRTYATLDAGKSTFVAASVATRSGPTSDHCTPSFSVWPLNRWNVSMPMPGFTSTSSISLGLTTVVCAASEDADTSRHTATNERVLHMGAWSSRARE